jgi:hypothetical protein
MAEIFFQLGKIPLVKKVMNVLPVGKHQVEEYDAYLLWKN